LLPQIRLFLKGFHWRRQRSHILALHLRGEGRRKSYTKLKALRAHRLDSAYYRSGRDSEKCWPGLPRERSKIDSSLSAGFFIHGSTRGSGDYLLPWTAFMIEHEYRRQALKRNMKRTWQAQKAEAAPQCWHGLVTPYHAWWMSFS